MIDSTTVCTEAERVIRHVVECWHRGQPDMVFVAVICDCDPAVGSFYVHLGTPTDDMDDDPLSWEMNCAEQTVPAHADPSWFAPYNSLISRHIAGEIDYAEVSHALGEILKGASLALASLDAEGFFQHNGFTPEARLGVMTEDDDNQQQAFDRVDAVRH